MPTKKRDINSRKRYVGKPNVGHASYLGLQVNVDVIT